jgi:hypothetical protein
LELSLRPTFLSLNRYPLYPLSLANIGPHLSASSPPSFPLSLSRNGNSQELILRYHCALTSHQDPTYKSPQMPTVDPLSSSSPRRRLSNAIARRSPQPLRASPVKFIDHGESRTPYPLLTFLPHPGTPTDALVLTYFTVKRHRGTHLKHHHRTVEPQPPLHTCTGRNLVSRSNDRVHHHRPRLVLVSITSRDFQNAGDINLLATTSPPVTGARDLGEEFDFNRQI